MLAKFGVRRPVFTLMIFIGLFVIGIFSIMKLPLDLLPNISFPAVSILTLYPGAGVEEVEENITKVVEEAVSTTSGIENVTSKTKEGVSVVTLKFTWNTNVDAAVNDIRDKLDMASSFLPEDVKRPTIFKFDLSSMPIMFIGFNADKSYPELYDILDKKVVEPLRRIEGVGAVIEMGGMQNRINIRIDKKRMEHYNLTFDRIVGAIKGSNLNYPTGKIIVGKRDLTLRVPGEFKSLDDIKNIIVGNVGNNVIRIRDVADVEEGYAKKERFVRVNGKSSIVLIVEKRSGGNTVAVSQKVRESLKHIKSTLPPDVDYNLVFDSADFIKHTINNLLVTILWGGVLIFIIVFIFLRSFKGSIIVALTIPFSLIIAFIFLYIRGYTMNMISISSLAIAIGMVVDNAIVVFENIYHFREKGYDPAHASIEATGEVARAITASTLTTIAIFFPIVLISGIVAVMFKQLAIAVIIVLAASLFCSMTLTPMLSFKLMRNVKKPEITGAYRRFYYSIERGMEALRRAYGIFLSKVLQKKKLTVAVALLIFLVSFIPLLTGYIGTEFTPREDQGVVNGTISLPYGTRLSVTDSIARKIEKIIDKDVPEKVVSYVKGGTSATGFGAIMGRAEGEDIINLMIQLVPKNKRKRSDLDISYQLENEIAKIPGIRKIDMTSEDPMQSMILGGAKPVSVDIYCHNFERADSVAKVVKDIMKDIPGTKDISISRESGKPELQIVLNREKLQKMGLSIYSISSALNKAYLGVKVGDFRRGGKTEDIFLDVSSADDNSMEMLKSFSFVTPFGNKVRLSDIAEFKERSAPIEIERKDRERVVHVEAATYHRAPGDVARELKKKLSSMVFPEGVDVSVKGSYETMGTTFRTLTIAMILGILLVYMVMASQFESFIDPFVIAFSIPFAVVGVLLALFYTGTTLNMMSFVGLVMLVGIVVNNAILLVDYTNTLRRRDKMPLVEAILTASKRRLRPILMTTLTTIFGVLPLAVYTGEGSESWRPLGVAIIGGLSISTLVTLIIVPTIYLIFESRKKRGVSP
ncbi:MAG: hypothetical protein B5M53_02755 [Candidatus Cloacimonas sp. 4484_209]|nr:MAG: hypothetical protein B5M53_02755 [Candidatus Cloacimonas sp. 4484_209]